MNWRPVVLVGRIVQLKSTIKTVIAAKAVMTVFI
jgi:hypothetical protein